MEAPEVHYRTIPALAAYIDRIGAEQLNFRRFVVKEHKDKYYIERTIVRIDQEGGIYCSNKEHAPTEEEASMIKGALMTVKFPRSIMASETQFKALSKKLGKTRMFPIYSRAKEGGIAMVQQRVDKDGDKNYIPWTMWSDGNWRAMEPDGKLPFYKPKKRTSARVMVHEGAKAAEAAEKLSKDKHHPWSAMLARYEHWGILGGALAPHRAEYNELGQHKPSEVIYVCDNDDPGADVLEKFSAHWGKSLKGIKFGSDFPMSWDIADALPEKMFDGSGEWIGPDLESLVKPATWATVKSEDEDGEVVVSLTDHFRREWTHTISPEFFIHKEWPNKLLQEDDFRSLVRPFRHKCDIADLLRASDASKVEGLDYRPDRPPGIYNINRRMVVNTCEPIQFKPVAGDYAILLDYFSRLIPDAADRTELMRWCATLIARPDIRMTYSVLIVSENQGVGKTTLGEKILAPIIGASNTSFPNEKDICDSAFNSWLARKRLIVVNEIYAGNSSRAYNQLKSVVTDMSVQVNEKFQPTYTIQNWAHVIASSNSKRALRIDPEDRRWLVPKVSEDASPQKFWNEFNQWLSNSKGHSKTVQWAMDFLEANEPVQPGMHAPFTEAKRAVIEEGYSRGMTAVRELLQLIEQREPEDAFVLDCDLVAFIHNTIYQGRHTDHLERPLTIRKVAKAMGWKCGPENKGCQEWKLAPFKGRIISKKSTIIERTPTSLAKSGAKPVDLKAYYSI